VKDFRQHSFLWDDPYSKAFPNRDQLSRKSAALFFCFTSKNVRDVGRRNEQVILKKMQ